MEKKKVYKCGACDATVNDSQNFCTECGTGLAPVDDAGNPKSKKELEKMDIASLKEKAVSAGLYESQSDIESSQKGMSAKEAKEELVELLSGELGFDSASDAMSPAQKKLETAIMGVLSQFKPKDAGKVVGGILQSAAMRTEDAEAFRRVVKSMM